MAALDGCSVQGGGLVQPFGWGPVSLRSSFRAVRERSGSAGIVH